MSNTIKLKSYSNNMEELVANAAITPGMLVEVMTTGKVRAHADQNGNAVPLFAMEDELQGKDITDAYAAGDRVQCWRPLPGDEVNALLVDGASVHIGDFLVSNGDGYLREFVGGDSGTAEELPLEIVAVAKEAIDRSGSSGEDTNATGRIRVAIV
jgi:hypothetical protein